MSLEFYQIVSIVELAWSCDQQQTLVMLLQLEAESTKLGAHTQAAVIRQAAAQLAQGQRIQVIQVDGSASGIPLEGLLSPPAPEPEPAAPTPAPSDVQPRRKRKV